MSEVKTQKELLKEIPSFVFQTILDNETTKIDLVVTGVNGITTVHFEAFRRRDNQCKRFHSLLGAMDWAEIPQQ